MQPQAFLSHAQHLVRTYSDPASCRSAVSRSYYAVFHAVRDLLAKEGLATSWDTSDHRGLPNRLKNSGHEGLRSIGRQLDFLRRARSTLGLMEASLICRPRS